MQNDTEGKEKEGDKQTNKTDTEGKDKEGDKQTKKKKQTYMDNKKDGDKKDKQAKVLVVTVCMLDDRDLWYIHACILN